MMPMLSGWTDVFQVPGTRTTGGKAQKYALTGPLWQGTLPEGVTEYKSPTNLVWIIGRTYCTGTPEDYKLVHALQDQYSLLPLSAYGKPYTPPRADVDPKIDMKTPVSEQVSRMDAATYSNMLATLLKDNPPAKADTSMVEKLAKLGIVPGQDFNVGKLDPAVAKGLKGVPKAAQEQIMGSAKSAGKNMNGWIVIPNTGLYGTNYVLRAYVNALGPGWNRPEDAVYPMALVDAEDQPFDGARKYVMKLPKGTTPPVKELKHWKEPPTSSAKRTRPRSASKPTSTATRWSRWK